MKTDALLTTAGRKWGPPPGHLNSDGQNLLVYGKQFGNVFIGVQPHLVMKVTRCGCFSFCQSAPRLCCLLHLLEQIWKADAVLHFGTHGSLEFMPGKDRDVWGLLPR